MLSSQTVTIFYYVLCDLTMLSNHTASQAVTVISGFPLLMTSFLSTLPSQAVTLFGASIYRVRRISIHTALAGSDGQEPPEEQKKE